MSWKIFWQKVSKDLLVSLLITYFLLLIPEIVLPGIVSSHFNPKYILAAILILGLIYAWLGNGHKIKESAKFSVVSRHLLHIILFIIAVMLVLSLYKMKLWQILVVTILSLALVIAAGNMLVEEE